MNNQWYCVSNHYNSFPSEINDSLGGLRIYWKKKGDIVQDAMHVLSFLPAEAVDLAGFGYGGLVVWWLSLHHPQRVNRLILIGSIPQKRFFAIGLRFLLRWFPRSMLISWRGEWAISRLESILLFFPKAETKVPTLWLLDEDDPFHNWKRETLPNWTYVQFVLFKGSAVSEIEDWRKKTKVFLEKMSNCVK